MPELVKKVNPQDVFAIGVIWPEENNSYRIESAFQDLVLRFEPSIRKGIMYLMSHPKDIADRGAAGERVANAAPEEIVLLLGWGLAVYTIGHETQEVVKIFEDIVRDVQSFIDKQCIHQAIGFVVTQEPIFRSLGGFCQRCGYEIRNWAWPKQESGAGQRATQKAGETINETDTIDTNKRIDLKPTDQEESLAQDEILSATDETSQRRNPMEPNDSITLRLRRAQEEGDTEKIQKVLDELEQLGKEAKDLNEKKPICVTT